MPSPTERSRFRLVVYGLLSVLVVLAAMPGYLTLAPAWRPLALRVACALIVITGCVRLVGKVRRSIDGDPPSVLDTPPPAPRGPALDERFLRLRDDLVFSSGSRHYFEVFLQPRLRALGGGEVSALPGRRRRGPSLRTLERLIAEIEQRP